MGPILLSVMPCAAHITFINARRQWEGMKFLCVADIHNSITYRRKIEKVCASQKPDYVICAGDFTVFESYIDQMMDWLAKLPVPVLLIHGNHEEGEVVRAMAKHRSNIHFIHGHIFEAKEAKTTGAKAESADAKAGMATKDVAIVGWGGGGFSVKDAEFEHWMKAHDDRLKKAKAIILVTHGPPHGNKLDYLYHDHVGNKSYTAFIKRYPATLFAISGHLHENFQKEDKMGKCRLVNPGPDGAIITV